MPWTGPVFTHAWDWEREAPRATLIYNARLEEELNGIASAVTQLKTEIDLGGGGGGSITDPELIALAGTVSAADTVPYYTGSGTAAVTGLSAFIRTLLDDPDAATARTTLAIPAPIPGPPGPTGPTGATGAAGTPGATGPPGPGLPAGGTTGQFPRKSSATDYATAWYTLTSSDVGLGNVNNTSDAAKPISTATQAALDAKQPLDAELTALAALVSAADRLPYYTGLGTAALATFTGFARTLLDDADAAAMRVTLGVDPAGTSNITDPELLALAGLASSANQLPYWTGAGTAANTPFTTFGRTLVDDADATAGRATLLLGTIATQNANAVAITGGTVTGITDLAIADGGTGASTAPAALSALGGQPLDAELTAIAGLTSAVDALPYFTGAGTAAVTTLTTYGRSLIDDANAAAAQTTLGLVPGTNVQAYDAELAAIAGLTSAADRAPYFTGLGTASLMTVTSFARTLLDDVDAAAMRATLNVDMAGAGGVTDPELLALAATTSAADMVPYYTGAGTASTTSLTSFARTLLDDTTQAAMRTTLALTPGTDVQTQDAELQAIAGLVSAADRAPYFTGVGAAALMTVTSFARTLLDDADAATMRATLNVDVAGSGGVTDPELLAIAGLVSAADRLPYFTGSGTASLATYTAFARTLDDDPDAATARTTLGVVNMVLGAGGAQAYDAELNAIAGLVSAADQVPYFTGSGTASLTTLTTFGRSLIDDASAAAAQTTLGLVIGTNVQAYDAELAAISGLTSAANQLPYFTGLGTAALTTLSAFGRTLIDDADAATMRATLGVDPAGTSNITDAELLAIAGLTSAADRVPYFTGLGTAALATFTGFGRSLVDDADAAAGRTTLALGTIATQNANAVAITGGTLNNVTVGHSDGTMAAPSIFFNSDPDTGIYRAFATAASVNVVIDSFSVATFASAAAYFPNGAATFPGISFQNDNDTGLYATNNGNILYFAAGGVAVGNFAAAGLTVAQQISAGGDIFIQKASPVLNLMKPASGTNAMINGYSAGNLRWSLRFGDSTAENATPPTDAVGSDFYLYGYLNDGTTPKIALSFTRSTGLGTVYGDPTAALGIATKQYVDGVGNLKLPIAGGTITGNLTVNGTTTVAAPTVNAHAATKLYADGKLALTGGTLTGDLAISKATPTLNLNKPATGDICYIQGQTGGNRRWSLRFGDSTTESGGGTNSGSDLILYRYTDTDTTIGAALSIVRSSGVTDFYNTLVRKPGGGSFTDNSDIRIKTLTGVYKSGLAEIVELNPIRYTFKGNDTLNDPFAEDHPDPKIAVPIDELAPFRRSSHYEAAKASQEFIGLAAQDVKKSFPECVTLTTGYIDGVRVDDLHALDTSPLLYALINAVKELNDKYNSLLTALHV